MRAGRAPQQAIGGILHVPPDGLSRSSAIMSAPDREQLLARVATGRDRLAVLSARTSNPELLHQIREADAIAAALEAECHRVSFVDARLRDRIALQTQAVERLAVDLNRDAVE
ncbi:MAG TPA: hypothetical protein VFV98_00010 [Vicinamibacterales bacterium]|nr:hypothetical protein [Vicinamibacterales bacterium]